MILDGIENAERYVSLHPGFAEAFEFLRRPDLAELDEGNHAIDGDRVYTVAMRGPGHPHSEARLETHRRHIDIQFLLSGHETIGWRPDSMLRKTDGLYNSEGDAQFFADKPQAWISLAPNQFVVLFPEDGHAGMIGEGEIRKVVVKVRCD
ncbi:YhcH/YjgK/YiaL family protein [Candidatus Sumerlaeota bacterium]|nr:YhcH/YjgK/YiaL family protein [Candidatus Sumerlaeota bacterium]